jgi:alpha-L-arabinofuranosidase
LQRHGGDTYWANLRRENGHEEPYNVRYWGLGNEMYGVVLDAYVECETHDLTTEASSWPHRVADLGPFDLLDVSVTCDAEGCDLTLVVVNRDPEREIETTIQLADSTFEGNAAVYKVTGESSGSINDFDHQAVGVSGQSLQTAGRSVEHGFPACSVTVLRAGLAG